MKNNTDEPQNVIPDQDSTSAHYTDPDAHAALFANKQDTLVSTINGEGNIKTINSDSILGTGDIAVSAIGHTHSAADITSGTLAVTNGGTGVTSMDALKTALGVGDVDIVKIDYSQDYDDMEIDSSWAGYLFCWKANGIVSVYSHNLDRDNNDSSFPDTIAILPVGYRPTGDRYAFCMCYEDDNTIGTVALCIESNGEVVLEGYDLSTINAGDDLIMSFSFPIELP